MDSRILYIHPYNHMMPHVIPVGTVAAINLLPNRAVGRFAHDVSRQDVENAQVVLIDLHWFFALPTIEAIVGRIRRIHPAAKVVIGGLTASFYARLLLDRLDCDYVVFGHAEVSFRELVTTLLAGDDPPPLPNVLSRRWTTPTTKDLTQEQFDRLDWIDVRWFPSFLAASRSSETRGGRPALAWSDAFPLLPLIRGCVRHCHFCFGAFQQRMFGDRVLQRSPDRLVHDLRRIEWDFGLPSVTLYSGDARFLIPHALRLANERFDLDVAIFCCGSPTPKVAETFADAFSGDVFWSLIQPSDLPPLPGDRPADDVQREFSQFIHHLEGLDRTGATVWHISASVPEDTATAVRGARACTASGIDWLATRPDDTVLSRTYTLADQLEDVTRDARRAGCALLLRGLVPSLSHIPVKAFGDADVFNPLLEWNCSEFEAALVRLSVDNMVERRFFGFDDLRLAWGLAPTDAGPACWDRCGAPIDGVLTWSFEARGMAWSGEVQVDSAVPQLLTVLPNVVTPTDVISIASWPEAIVPGVPIEAGPPRVVRAGGRLLGEDVELWREDGGRRVQWTLRRPCRGDGVRGPSSSQDPEWARTVLDLLAQHGLPRQVLTNAWRVEQDTLVLNLRVGQGNHPVEAEISVAPNATPHCHFSAEGLTQRERTLVQNLVTRCVQKALSNTARAPRSTRGGRSLRSCSSTRLLFLHVHEPHTEFNASIAALAGVAKHLGAQHEVLGIPAGAPVAPVLEEIRKRRADIVAASLFTRYLPGFRALFSGLASNTDALKIVGGPHPTVRPGDMLRWEGMDAIVLGEGERPLAHILRELAAGRSLKTRPGLWVRDADGFHGDPPTADAEPFIGDNPQ